MNHSADETTIREIIQSLATAWNNGDGAAFGAPFTDNADYTVWNGHHVQGKEAIIRGHQRLFETVYKGTVQRLELEKIRFLQEDIAVVHGLGGMIDTEPERWPKVKPLFIFVKRNGTWQIDVFHNTPVINDQGTPPTGSR
jgi:uncharacterized protein (TIGR02246 family)